MPCLAVTPSMPVPRDGRCGASVLPLPPRDAPTLSAEPSTSFYARLWKFLLHWNAHEVKTLTDELPTQRRRRASTSRLSACSEMRRRVGMLQELETHGLEDKLQATRGPRAMQATCSNCRQRFFRDLATASTSAIDYCSLDCRSSAQYRATVQQSIDAFDCISSSRL